MMSIQKFRAVFTFLTVEGGRVTGTKSNFPEPRVLHKVRVSFCRVCIDKWLSNDDPITEYNNLMTRANK